jgi:2-amino-4-hydroxy-6-hydroxymethyldihydropteridine diphosphokinase
MPLEKQIQNQPNQLILPHPRIQDRLFVLKPLSEIDPDWIHPVLNKKPLELIDQNNWNKESLLSLVSYKKFIL